MSVEVVGKDKEKTATDGVSNELQKLKEAAEAKERESQLKDRLLESQGALIAMMKRSNEELLTKLKLKEEIIASMEKKDAGDVTLVDSAMLTDSMDSSKETPPTEEPLSRAAIAAQKLGVSLDIVEPPNEWKEKCEKLERDMETVKRLYRAEQQTVRKLRETGGKVKKEAVEVEPIQVDDMEANEMVTSPLDPVQLAGQKRRQKQQLKRRREEGNVLAMAVSDDIQLVARGEENDGNVVLSAEERAKTTMDKSARGNRTHDVSGRRMVTAVASVPVKKKQAVAANPINGKVATGAFPCAKCPHLIAFTSAQLLQQHVNACHNDRHRFPCDQCGQSFTKMGNLDTHKKQVHDGVKQFTCPICDTSFVRKQHLTVHERRHTGERPFTCSVCQKTFFDSSNLRAHERAHSGEKRYCCQYCARKFNVTGHCRKHQEICSQRPK